MKKAYNTTHHNLFVGFIVFLLLLVLAVGTVNAKQEMEFVLPEWGGAMVHSTPGLKDYICLPVPTNNITICWHRNQLNGEQGGAKGNGVAGNGNIAACSFFGKRDTVVIYDYDGNRIWSSGTLLNAYALFSTPMVDIYDRVIACDNEVIVMIDPFDRDADNKIVEWVSPIPYGGLPLSPVITQDGTILIATDEGPIYAYDSLDGSLLSWMYLGKNEQVGFLYRIFHKNAPGYFSTINTPCVKGNRLYISTQYKGPKGLPTLLHHARLYAVDVDAHNPVISERLTVAWYYEFGGKSQASPTLINDTIYFDGYRPVPSLRRNPHVFAVTDKEGYWEETFKTPYDLPTYASFTYDPRGGFWYVDPFGGKLTHFSAKDGRIIEQIVTDDLVNEKGTHIPSSVMTICGNETRPVLIVSATALRPISASSYVLAIDLARNNSLLWKVKIYSGPLSSIDLAFGQYTILMKNGEPRLVFGSFGDGVWAIGSEET